jgi:hypothetical protein
VRSRFTIESQRGSLVVALARFLLVDGWFILTPVLFPAAEITLPVFAKCNTPFLAFKFDSWEAGPEKVRSSPEDRSKSGNCGQLSSRILQDGAEDHGLLVLFVFRCKKKRHRTALRLSLQVRKGTSIVFQLIATSSSLATLYFP